MNGKQGSLLYKRNAPEVAQRLGSLWTRQAPNRIFAHINLPAEAQRRFTETHEDGPTSYPDPHERIALWDTQLYETRDLEDDWLPIAYLSEFDQGIVGGALGAEMRFMMNSGSGWVSSMCVPLLHSLDDLDMLKIDPEAAAVELLDTQVRIFAKVARGKFGIAPFIIIDALNFVAEMRGMTQAFEDVFDDPEAVTRMMDFALEFNIFLQSRVRSVTDGFMDGSFTYTGSWCPGNPVMFSVDAYHMASPEFYYQWGVPHLQKILDHFGGGLLHLHSNGRHLLPHVVKLDHLVCVAMGDDVGNPRAYAVLPALLREAGNVPLIIGCRYEEFESDLDAGKLSGNVLYELQGVPSIDAGNRLMEKVRAYRSES